jgi:uncharacterized protein GlcG (DUF336 family)
MLSLRDAQTILMAALAYAREHQLQPLAIAVLDARGAIKAFAAEDKTGLHRGEIAIGKASGAIGFGLGSRALARRGRDVPHFINAVAQLFPRGLVPVAGGVLITGSDGEVLGAVGVSGDASLADEDAAIAGIAAAGFRADPGSDEE